MEERGISIDDLPVAWEQTHLKDVCEIILGQSPPSETYNTIGKGLPFFQGKAEFTELHPITEKWCSVPGKIAEQNDILLSVRAPVGNTNIADRKCCIGRGLAALRFHNHKFLFYYLRSIEKELDKKGTGTTFKAISGDIVRNVDFPLPPLLEQHRIVAKIEELFSELDKGVEALKTARQQLKVYRQAVLKWAFAGKLTDEWRRLNENINFDFAIKKILQERKDAFEIKLAQAKENKTPKPRTPKNLDKKFKINQEHIRFVDQKPNEWIAVHLAVVSNNMPDSIVDGPFGSSINVESDYVESGVPVIRTHNILPFLFERNKLKYIREEKFSELKRHNVLPGDVLFGKVGTIGNSCIYPIAEPEAMLSTTGSCRFRVDEKIITNKFLCYYLNSQRGNFNEIASAAVQAFLNMETINNFPIPLCSLEEQHAIVQEIETRLSVADKLEETITQSLQQAEALRQSILKKAFAGKLVPQDPNDEPASKLLELIKAEKATQGPVKRSK
jgi:type I restriction enzyme S subunit